MKLIKSLIVAGSVALALGALQTNAESIFPSLPFTLTSTNQFEPLAFNLTVTEQELYYTNVNGNTNVYTSTVKTQKANAQSILQTMSSALAVTFPAGAKLAVNLSNGHVCVVDKTAQNLLYDLSIETSSSTNDVEINDVYADFSADGDYAVISGKQQESHFVEKQTTIVPVEFYFYAYRNGGQEISIDVYGNDASVFNANTKAASQTDSAPVSGDGYIGDSNLSIAGQVSGSGSWKAAPAQ